MNETMIFLLGLPLILLQVGLQIFAFLDVLKQSEFKYFNRNVWILITLFFGFLGVICYFVFGKQQA